MNNIIALVLYTFGALTCVLSLIEWFYAWYCKRGRMFKQVCKHTILQIMSRRIWMLFASFLALLLLISSNTASLPPVVFAISCICASIVLRWLTPPSVLLLGVSGSATNQLLLTLRSAMFPGKVIHILKPGDALYDPDVGYDIKLETEYTTSRASSPTIVEGYLQLCEGILVDLRQSSSNLAVELEMIGRLEDKSKVVLLYDQYRCIATHVSYQLWKENTCSSESEAFCILRGRMRRHLHIGY